MGNINAIAGSTTGQLSRVHSIAPSTPPKPPENPSLLAAQQIARGQVSRVLTRHKTQPFKTWDEVEAFVGFAVNVVFKAMPLDYLSLRTWADNWVSGTEARIAASLAAAKLANAQVTTPAWKDDNLDNLLPFNLPPPLRNIPQQRKAYKQIVRELGLTDIGAYQNPRSKAALLPLPGGQGKTAIAAMVIKWFQENNYFKQGMVIPFNNIIYITPKPVKQKTLRFFDVAGIKNLHLEVLVVTYTELRSKKWQAMFKEVKGVNPIDGAEFETYEYTMPAFYPSLLVVDESHTIKKPNALTTKKVTALIGPDTRVLYMSATSAVTVNDLATFAITSGKKWDGRPITRHNWKEVAYSICQSDPRRPNAAGMKRAKEFFGDAIVCPPADPRKVKCYNSVKLLRFQTDKQRQQYATAQDRWLETCERLGKIPSERGAVMAATQIFAAAEELIKAPNFVDEGIEELKAGRAVVIGVRFIETVKEIFGDFMRRINPHTGKQFTRDDISIIYGGEKIITADEVYSNTEFQRVATRVNESPEGELCLTKKERAKFRKTMKYLSDRIRREENSADQAARVAWLKETRLDAQDEFSRQEEMDAFQSGKTVVCIFTLSSGGTGIDLDHQHEGALPRTMLSTICYYLEQFIQAMCRCYRVSTISDTYQRVLFFEGTLIANHMAPKLASKIKSINAFSATGINMESDLVDAVVTGKVKPTDLPPPIDTTPVEAEDMDAAVEDEEDDEENGEE